MALSTKSQKPSKFPLLANFCPSPARTSTNRLPSHLRLHWSIVLLLEQIRTFPNRAWMLDSMQVQVLQGGLYQ